MQWRFPESLDGKVTDVIEYFCDDFGKILGYVKPDKLIYIAYYNGKFIGSYITRTDAKIGVENSDQEFVENL